MAALPTAKITGLIDEVLNFLEEAAEDKKFTISECEKAIAQLRQVKEVLQAPTNKTPKWEPQSSTVKSSSTLLYNTFSLSPRPALAYRIVFHDSWTIGTANCGLKPQRNPTGPIGDSTFTRMVQNHIDWDSSTASPFISLFCDKLHAQRWARKLLGNFGRDKYEVLAIDLSILANKLVYNLGTLVKNLGIKTPLQPLQYEKELLVLGEIPGSAVVKREKWPPASNVDELFGPLANMRLNA